MKKVIIIGASGGGRKMYYFIKQFDKYEICLFLDNFPKQRTYLGLEVMQADRFLKSDGSKEYYYCIGSTYWKEIYAQLIEAGIREDHIYSKLGILLENKKWFFDQLRSNVRKSGECDRGKNPTVIFDLLNGFGLGGVEKWSYDLSREYAKEKEVILLGNRSQGEPPKEFSGISSFVDVEDSNDFSIESIKKMIDFLQDHLPGIVYCAHINDLFIACMLLKEMLKEQLTLVSVIHGGLQSILDENIVLYDKMDYILCVSPDTQKYIKQVTNDRKNKVLFKESPINIPNLGDRQYTLDKKEPLKIAYAARLEMTHKHSELIIPLVTLLEKRKINYQLDIAGDGSLYEELCKFVQSSSLRGRVCMLGRLNYEDMERFWLNHDTAINLSDTEGCSVAMLEAMAAATVPIFTDVPSTEYFITNGWNGYIVPFNDIERMIRCLEELECDREKLMSMGIRSAKIIDEKCKLKEYMDYLDKYIL